MTTYSAPSGNYTYNAYVGTFPSIIIDEDNFPFEKLTTGYGPTVNGWTNTGESFDDWFMAGGEAPVPDVYSLGQNYPNPFNPLTTIRFELRDASFVNLTVFDISGRTVGMLVDGWRDAGYHEVTWDASDLASGLYFYRIEAGDFTAVKKMVLMK